jgi:single-strand DNA-binding protein
MANDLNKVLIIGRLGKDPEMRYTPGGSPVTTNALFAGTCSSTELIRE